MELLEMVLYMGNLLATTPTKPPGKIYPSVVLTFFVVNVAAATIFKKSDYMSMIHVKFVIAVLMDSTLFFFNLIVIIIPAFWKRKEWYKLVKILTILRSLQDKKSSPVYFIIIQIIFWAITLYDTYAWTMIMEFEFLKQYGVEILQSFLLFHHQCLLHVAINIVLEGYKDVITKFYTIELLNKESAKLIKHKLGLLQVCVRLFSEVFGWPFLLIIVYTSFQMLNYFDDSFENGFLYDENEYDEVIISNVCFLIITVGYTVFLIWLWDSVLAEVDKVQHFCRNVSDELQTNYFVIISNDIVNNCPKSSVADFFYVDRALIFNMFSVTFTFLIVMIQFKERPNLSSYEYLNQ
ncbi:hypothetical protein Zmor_025093 [Zophobas morio]|uniref:Gustatory receptor n=1 Tax=Zophobas morio TaxID=2755281 RepID=A0AA38M3E7_9CUCU|nr:hypothetical protein Zmor_025093 [Zophobas morio]